MQGIETLYKNILFRSKLETRWAAYFDLCGIKWKYEPWALTVLDGAKCVNYIPDFIIELDDSLVYVEVKPASLYASTQKIFDAVRSGYVGRVPKHVYATFRNEPFIIVFGEPHSHTHICNLHVKPHFVFPNITAAVAAL